MKVRPSAVLLIVLVALALLLAIGAWAVGPEGGGLEPGDRFPGFSLPRHDGGRIDSRDLTGGPYLLFYYPKAGTPACTVEACGFRDAYEELEEAGLRVFGVSFDGPSRNAEFADENELPFPLLSDEGGVLAGRLGATRRWFDLPLRVSFLVDAEGRLIRRYEDVDPETHASRVLDDLLRRREAQEDAPQGI